MPAGNSPNSALITRQPDLSHLAGALALERIIAVDTESNSLYAYREQVCLIQFSTSRQDYLVDPLALKDLSALGPIFENPAIEKVFHAAEYDVLCLRRDFNFRFANLFDTMLAARILGREEIGLGAMLEAEFNIHLDKRYQRANWGQRPLPIPLILYARQDTHHLIALRDRLKAELVERELWPLAAEDFSRMCTVNGSLGENRQPDCWRISGAQDLQPQQAAVLMELCRFRDKVARSVNRPLFKVINDQVLLDIALQGPHSLQELYKVPGLSKNQVERYGAALLEASRRGMDAQPIYPPRTPRPSDEVLERLDSLRRWRKDTALKLNMKSDVVLPRDLLHTLAERNPRSLDELTVILRDVPWRLERFGRQILDILSLSQA